MAEPLTEPRDGLPEVVADPDQLAEAVASLRSGVGPIAIDAERASGFRYGQRAYLIQLRREGSGTWLIDPIGFESLAALNEEIDDAEWILHSALQDLPCMSELGLHPTLLFDTELAARILGRPKVGLAALVESELGLVLEKGHSAADWSTRPLPESWIRYAALDVEVLIELRDLLHAELVETGRWEWAAAEFAHIAALPPPEPRKDPWRRTSGIHRLRKPRQLAIVHELWIARDEIAQMRDVSPGRIINDDTIIAIATTVPESTIAMGAIPGFRRKGASRYLGAMWSALQRALTMSEDDLPTHAPPGDGLPPPRIWRERNPEAARRLAALRACVVASAEEYGMPAEVLIPPESVRQLAWDPPVDVTSDAVAAVLRVHGAREWQVALMADRLCEALVAPVADVDQDEAESDSFAGS